MIQTLRKLWKKIDGVIHPPIPPKIQQYEVDFKPKGGPEVKVYTPRARSQNTPYRRWRKIRNHMASESRRINRG